MRRAVVRQYSENFSRSEGKSVVSPGSPCSQAFTSLPATPPPPQLLSFYASRCAGHEPQTKAPTQKTPSRGTTNPPPPPPQAGVQRPQPRALGPRNGVPATRASRGAPRGDERKLERDFPLRR